MATKSANVMARVEPDIKIKAETILAQLGLPASVVINALYHQIIYTEGVPFPLVMPPKVPVLDKMNKSDFDKMMQESLAEVEQGKTESAKDAFDEILNEFHK